MHDLEMCLDVKTDDIFKMYISHLIEENIFQVSTLGKRNINFDLQKAIQL